MRERLSSALGEARAVTIALLAAMAVGSLLILSYGRSPAQVYGMMLAETWGSAEGLGEVAFRAGPLVLTGLAVALAFRAGLINIGAEGQAMAGAFAAGILGPVLGGWPVGVGALLCLVLAAAVGGAAGALPGVLKARFSAHEVITTMMLNFVLIGVIKQLGHDHFYAWPQEHTHAIARAARLGSDPATGTLLSSLLALAAAVAVAWLLARTRTGFELRALGASHDAAETAGISPARVTIVAMTLSGALAGLVAGGLVLGHKGYFQADLVTGYGFMGIAVALLGRAHPVGIVLGAWFIATLSRGGVAAASLVPKEIVDVLQAVLILSLAGAAALARRAGWSLPLVARPASPLEATTMKPTQDPP